MFEGLLQPMHLVVLLVVVPGAFLVGRLLWRLGSKKK
jgi:hypothetical protein